MTKKKSANSDELQKFLDLLETQNKPHRSLEAAIANHFTSTSCGVLHMGWAIDAFWTKVANDIFIPGLIKIHEALVKKKSTETKPISWGDADGNLYHVPCGDRKVIVFTTQSRNYLFIVSPAIMLDNSGEEKESHTLHIRRVWPKYKKPTYKLWAEDEEKRILSTMSRAITSVETLAQYSDDHGQYPHRPSLDMYHKIDFNLDKYNDKPRFYGDCRDPGYIMSLGSHGCRMPLDKAEYTSHHFSELAILATCNLGVMARDAGVKIKELDGYG